MSRATLQKALFLKFHSQIKKNKKKEGTKQMKNKKRKMEYE
jgi:hypothetical protein